MIRFCIAALSLTFLAGCATCPAPSLLPHSAAVRREAAPVPPPVPVLAPTAPAPAPAPVSPGLKWVH